jgi:hypothetical protein
MSTSLLHLAIQQKDMLWSARFSFFFLLEEHDGMGYTMRASLYLHSFFNLAAK